MEPFPKWRRQLFHFFVSSETVNYQCVVLKSFMSILFHYHFTEQVNHNYHMRVIVGHHQWHPSTKNRVSHIWVFQTQLGLGSVQEKSVPTLQKSRFWLEMLSLTIRINLIFRLQNRNQFKKPESESIFLKFGGIPGIQLFFDMSNQESHKANFLPSVPDRFKFVLNLFNISHQDLLLQSF